MRDTDFWDVASRGAPPRGRGETRAFPWILPILLTLAFLGLVIAAWRMVR